MKAQSFFEQNGGTYMQVGDYYIPDLKDEEPGHYSIGKYGRMRKRYLQEHRCSPGRWPSRRVQPKHSKRQIKWSGCGA